MCEWLPGQDGMDSVVPGYCADGKLSRAESDATRGKVAVWRLSAEAEVLVQEWKVASWPLEDIVRACAGSSGKRRACEERSPKGGWAGKIRKVYLPAFADHILRVL